MRDPWGSEGLPPEKLFKTTPSRTLENALLGHGRTLLSSFIIPNYNEVEQDNDETDRERIDLEKHDCIVNEPNQRYLVRTRRPPQRSELLHN